MHSWTKDLLKANPDYKESHGSHGNFYEGE